MDRSSQGSDNLALQNGEGTQNTSQPFSGTPTSSSHLGTERTQRVPLRTQQILALNGTGAHRAPKATRMVRTRWRVEHLFPPQPTPACPTQTRLIRPLPPPSSSAGRNADCTHWAHPRFRLQRPIILSQPRSERERSSREWPSACGAPKAFLAPSFVQRKDLLSSQSRPASTTHLPNTSIRHRNPDPNREPVNPKHVSEDSPLLTVQHTSSRAFVSSNSHSLILSISPSLLALH